MIFMESFFCGESASVACTPTSIAQITKVTLSNAWFDDIRMTRNTDETISERVQQFWDYDTIMHAKFDNDTYAGNVKWDIERVSYLLIKRKKITDFKWTTIDYKDVQEATEVEEYHIEGIDITAVPGYTYQYAVVAIVDNVEDEYSIDTVEVKCHGIVMADATALYYTYLTDMFLDNVSVTPNSVVETMYDRYPTIVRNTLANYEQVTVNAEFIPYVDECEFDYGDDVLRNKYNKEVKMFLRNGYTKILKSENGQIWLGYITTPPSDSADQYYYTRKVTFTLTETGDTDSEKYLYKAGIIDVPQTFWSYEN
jgi:hypothetical protein